ARAGRGSPGAKPGASLDAATRDGGTSLIEDWHRVRISWSRTTAGGVSHEAPPAADEVYSVGAGADGSFCHRPNSLPWGSLQVANQPMLGTGAGSFASPPSSFPPPARALVSS